MSARTWAHGDGPTAGFMNDLSADLNAWHSKLGDVATFPAVPYTSELDAYLIHTHRFLYWRSVGKLLSLDGTQTITLEENQYTAGLGGEYGLLDLDTVGWLTYGQMYHITGVTCAMEDDE